MNHNNMGDKTGSGDKGGDDNDGKGPSEFFIGLTTFIIFLVFMTIWMYFSV